MFENYKANEWVGEKFSVITDIRKDFWKGRSVLDLGCNAGGLYPVIKKLGAVYTGVDAGGKYIEEARQNFPDGKFILSKLEKYNEYHDVVVCIDVLHHFGLNAFKGILEKYSKQCRVFIFGVPVVPGNYWGQFYNTRNRQRNMDLANRYFDYSWCYGAYNSSHDEGSVREMFKCENYQDKYLEFKDVYTRAFGKKMSILECPYIEMIKQLRGRVKTENSKYFKWMLEHQEIKGSVWGVEMTEEEVLEKVQGMRDNLEEIRSNYDESKIVKNVVAGRLYGDLLVRDMGSEYELMDGHHRVCSLILDGVSGFNFKTCL